MSVELLKLHDTFILNNYVGSGSFDRAKRRRAYPLGTRGPFPDGSLCSREEKTDVLDPPLLVVVELSFVRLVQKVFVEH